MNKLRAQPTPPIDPTPAPAIVPAPTPGPVAGSELPIQPASVMPQDTGTGQRRLSGLFFTGLPATAVGLGLLSFGAVAFSENGKCADSDQPCNTRYDSRGQGIGTTVAGGVLLGVGVTFMAVDLYRRSHAKSRTAGLAGAGDASLSAVNGLADLRR